MAILPRTELEKLFGHIEYTSNKDGTIKISNNWARNNIVTITTELIPRIVCHKKISKQLKEALHKIYLDGPKGIIREYNGCWVPRHMRWDPSAPLSRHSWGIAIDFNASTNPYGKANDENKPIADIFNEFGFVWGGTWSSKYIDPMHFEVIKVLD